MKILLSRISGSVDNIEEFMKKVDADVSRLSSIIPSALGQVLQMTKIIMDRVSQVNVYRLFMLIVNRLILVIRHTQFSTHRGPLFPVFTK